MSEPKKKIIKTFDGECVVTLRKAKHSKTGKMVDYLSFSDGLNATGVFLGKDTKKEIVEFISGKGATRGNSNKSE